MDHEKYMRQALELAKEAASAGEVPVGCVITDSRGAVIAEGRNRREETRGVCDHAELEALEKASRIRGDWRLDDCTLYVTLEPCPMCAGAMINARLGRLVYGAREPQFGSAASVLNLFEEAFPSHTAILGGVMAEECGAEMSAFFQKKR